MEGKVCLGSLFQGLLSALKRKVWRTAVETTGCLRGWLFTSGGAWKLAAGTSQALPAPKQCHQPVTMPSKQKPVGNSPQALTEEGNVPHTVCPKLWSPTGSECCCYLGGRRERETQAVTHRPPHPAPQELRPGLWSPCVILSTRQNYAPFGNAWLHSCLKIPWYFGDR